MLLGFLALASTSPAWTMALGGDVMYNGISVRTKPLAGVARLFKGADIAVANLEIPLVLKGKPTTRKTAKELKARSQFILKADPNHAKDLRDAGLDLVTLASNHMMDYGPEGLAQTTKPLSKFGLGYAGAGLDEKAAGNAGLVESQNGGKVAVVAALSFLGHTANWKATPATPNSAGVMSLAFGGQVGEKQKAVLVDWVKRARRTAPFVMVAVHSGIEKKSLPTSYQVSISRAIIDAGADLVVGHHPHVLQGAELYKGKPILYSLGNLVSPMPGTTAVFHLRFQGDKLVRFAITPCRIGGGLVKPLGGLKATQQAAAFDALSRKLARTFPSKHAVPLLSRAEFSADR